MLCTLTQSDVSKSLKRHEPMSPLNKLLLINSSILQETKKLHDESKK